jgi:hypothetical protein
MTPEEELAKRRKANIRVMAIVLTGLVALIYFVSIAKMGLRK